MINSANSHSAFVTLELRAAGLCVPLAQVGHDFAIPLESVDLPPCEGEILMTVDGELTRTSVTLHEGGQIRRRRIPLSKVAELKPNSSSHSP